MKSKKALSAASCPSRIFKNDVIIKCPVCMVLCSGGCLTVAANSKNKETTTSLFFSRCQRSKVIFRVTQKALRDFLNYYRKNLALRGSDHAKHKSGVPWIYPPLENTLTLVAYFKVTLQPFRFSPDGRKTVGLSCTLRYREVHNLKYNGYGE